MPFCREWISAVIFCVWMLSFMMKSIDFFYKSLNCSCLRRYISTSFSFLISMSYLAFSSLFSCYFITYLSALYSFW